MCIIFPETICIILYDHMVLGSFLHFLSNVTHLDAKPRNRALCMSEQHDNLLVLCDEIHVLLIIIQMLIFVSYKNDVLNQCIQRAYDLHSYTDNTYSFGTDVSIAMDNRTKTNWFEKKWFNSG